MIQTNPDENASAKEITIFSMVDRICCKMSENFASNNIPRTFCADIEVGQVKREIREGKFSM